MVPQAPEKGAVIRMLGELLKELREKRSAAGPKVTRTAISAHIKTAPPFWGMVERGKSRPGLANLLAVLELLGVDDDNIVRARMLLAASHVDDDLIRGGMLGALGARIETRREEEKKTATDERWQKTFRAIGDRARAAKAAEKQAPYAPKERTTASSTHHRRTG